MFKALQSGQPVSLPYMHRVSTIPTPNMGEMFGQHLEPAGEYLSHHPYDHKPEMFGDPRSKSTGATYNEYGDVHFKNPFVVHVPLGGNTVSWKKSVSEAFGGLKGEKLSQRIQEKGHDGVVAVTPDGQDIMEMVRLGAPKIISQPMPVAGQLLRGAKKMQKLGKSQREKEVERVASIAAFRDGKLLWGKRNDNGRWTMPGGHLEEGEAPEKGAVRELLEETGLKPKKLTYLGEKTIRDGTLTVFSFRAEVEGEPDGCDDPDEECSEWMWTSLDNIPEEILGNMHSRKNVTLDFLQEGLSKSEAQSLDDLPIHEIDIPEDDMWINEFAHGRAK